MTLQTKLPELNALLQLPRLKAKTKVESIKCHKNMQAITESLANPQNQKQKLAARTATVKFIEFIKKFKLILRHRTFGRQIFGHS